MTTSTGANFSMEIVRYVGDTFPEEFVLVDQCGSPIDITDRAFTLTVNSIKNPTSGDPDLYELTGTITDAKPGKYEFPVSLAQAESPPGEYFFDIRMTYNPGEGTVSKVVGGGTWTIVQGIS